MNLIAKLKHYLKSDEDGSATAWNLTWFAIFGAGAGLAIDVSNARQVKEHLQVAAEIASHAGSVVLANGGSVEDARAAAVNSISINVPSSVYGYVVASETSDLYTANWDPETATYTSSGVSSAFQVQLHRDSSTANPVGTFLLKFVGFDEWQFGASGAAVHTDVQRCESSEGIFAQGDIGLGSQNTFAAGHCVHGAGLVSMQVDNTFDSGAFISMPNLEDCGNKCTDNSFNPGIVAAAHEANYLTPDITAWIGKVEASFTDPMASTAIRDDFYDGKNLDYDLSPLDDPSLGIDTSLLSIGDVVNLTKMQFDGLANVPEGLTYNISCPSTGNPHNRKLEFNNASLRDVAIITNCYFDFGSSSDILGTVLLSSSTTGISESAGAKIGAQNGSCLAEDRVTVLSYEDFNVAAKFVASNVTFIIDGDVHLASGGSGTSNHYGVAIHTSGNVDLTTQHTFNSCGAGTTAMDPTLEVIRQIEPV